MIQVNDFGTMTFGKDWPGGAGEAPARALPERYIDASGNFSDTPDNYGGGRIEEIAGRFVAGRHRGSLAPDHRPGGGRRVMQLDPAFASLLALPGVELAPPPNADGAAQLRAQLAAATRPGPKRRLARICEVYARNGSHRVRVRLYYPSRRAGLPLVVYLHGGGFVLCDLESHDDFCRELAHASGCGIASVEYRLAPEHRYPVPLEDCYAATRWLARNAAHLGFDASRIAVAGDSAGGTLATAVALLARDRRGPTLRHQLLLFPATDAACDSASMHEFASGYLLSARMMRWYWDCYLGGARADEPLASPLRAADLAGLPPACIVTAEFDTLRDEGEQYADRLRAAGVAVTARRYLGVIHGFAFMPFVSSLAGRMVADVAGDLRAAFGHAGAR